MVDDQVEQQEQDEAGGDASLEAQLDGEDGDAGAYDDNNESELIAMRARLKAMEEEAAKLAKGRDTGPGGKPSAAMADVETDAASKEEVDGRSIYVGNVDYSCTPEELQLHFQACGTVNRVTILTDKMGNAKGFAYVEFLEADALTSASLLDGTELRGREIKVSPKRTNVPGLKAYRGGRGGGRGRGRGRGGYYGYGSRGRGRGRSYYSPY